MQFQANHDRYAVDDPGGSWRKYLDLDYWMAINLRRVQELELDWGAVKAFSMSAREQVISCTFATDWVIAPSASISKTCRCSVKCFARSGLSA